MRASGINPIHMILMLLTGQYEKLARKEVSIRYVLAMLGTVVALTLLFHAFDETLHEFFLRNYEENSSFVSANPPLINWPLINLLQGLNCFAIGAIFVGLQSEMRFGTIIAALLLSFQLLNLIGEAFFYYLSSAAEFLFLDRDLGWASPSIFYTYYLTALLLALNGFLIFRLYRWIGSVPAISPLQHPFFAFYILSNGVIVRLVGVV